MAISKSFEEFAKRIKIRGEEFESSVSKLIRQATNAALASAIVGTPIDKGQAKNNWFVSGEAADLTSLIPSDEDIGDNTAAVISRAQNAIKEWKSGDGSLFITNNLPYIVPLDEGYSRQNPEGMSKQAIAAAKQVLNNPSSIFKD